MLTDRTEDQRIAMAHAVALHSSGFKPGDSSDLYVRRTASVIFNWLSGPVVMRLTVGPVCDQVTGQPTGKTVGGPVAQLRDTEQFTLSVDVSDAKGASIPDQAGSDDNVGWSVDDGDVATLQVSEDSRQCTVVAGNVGSAVVTVTLGDLSATLAVDVIPGAAARLVINEGSIEPQPSLP
jgi:hypothetical protein